MTAQDFTNYLKTIPGGIDLTKLYRLYIDESGDHTYGKKELGEFKIKLKEKVVSIPVNHYPQLETPDKRYLALVGSIIEAEKYRTTFHPALESLKQKYFLYDPDEPVTLHREDIINKRGHFWRLRDTEQEKAFNNDLLAFLREMEYTIITVVIDKKSHIKRYQEFAYHPYHYCLGAMLERYSGFLHFYNAKGDVLAESRGGKEDNQLKEAYRSMYNSGTQFRKPKFFHDVLTSKEVKIKPKSANIAGLQLSDILAHPLKQEILLENNRLSNSGREIFGRKICEIIKEKYNNYKEKIYGYGKVFLE